MRRAVWLALLACEPLPAVTAEGEHVVIAADEGLAPCGGTVAHMDRFVARAAATLSRAAPTGAGRFRYFWLDPDGFVERSDCPPGVAACARGATVYSQLAPADHEFVHNVAAGLGDPLPFFAEGLAVAYEGLGDDPGSAATVRPTSAEIAALIPLPQALLLAQPGSYRTAGQFTAFLIARHGISAYLRAYGEIDESADLAAVDAAFMAAFGEPLAASLAAFAADGTIGACPRDGFDAKLVECAAPPLEWDGFDLSLHREVACADPDVVGPFAGGAAVVLHTLEVSEGGRFELRVVGDRRDRVSLVQCEACPSPTLHVGSAGDPPRAITLPAGRYSLRLHAPSEVRSRVGLRLRRLPEPPA